MAYYTNVAISAGHGQIVKGAVGNGLEEHEQATRVAKRVAELANSKGCNFKFYEEKTAKTQSQNLSNIVNWHNAQNRQIDVSVHFNSASATATGAEVLVCGTTPAATYLARRVSADIATALGIPNRGVKNRAGLRFLNSTKKPAILIEVCFLSNADDVKKYKANFEKVCKAIATAITGKTFPATKKVNLNQGSADIKVESAHMGIFKNTKKVNVYDSEGNVIKQIAKGSWKVYKTNNGMLNVGGDQWVNKEDGTLTQRTFTSTLQLNIFKKPAISQANYVKKLAKGTWKIYEINLKQQMAKIGENQWVQINVKGVELD